MARRGPAILAMALLGACVVDEPAAPLPGEQPAQALGFQRDGRLGGSLGPAAGGYPLPASFAFSTAAPFTFELWLLRDRAVDNEMLFDSRDAGGRGMYGYLTADGHVRIAARGDQGPTTIVATAEGGYDNGIWHHVAFTVDAQRRLTLYVDGIAAPDRPVLYPRPTATPARLAAPLGDGPFVAWRGRLDEVRFWFDARAMAGVRAAMCEIAGPRAVPLDTATVRLGAYVWKGAMHCTRRWLAQSFDLLSSRIGTWRDRPFGGATIEQSVRSYDPTTLLLLQSTPTFLPRSFDHLHPGGSGQSIAGAQLVRADGTEVVSRLSATHHNYDPAHPALAEAWLAFLERRFLRATPGDPDIDLSLDGVIADDMPLGGADRFRVDGAYAANIGMRAAQSPSIVYDGSVTRRLIGTLAFVANARTYGPENRLIGINVTHHELGADFGQRLVDAGLQLAWFEQWVRSYASSRADGGKSPTARLRDIQLAEQLSAAGIPALVAPAFQVGDARSLESVIAFYLLARRGDSLVLQPMPVDRTRDRFRVEDFSALNAASTEGFSAHYLFERLNPFRAMLERDLGAPAGPRAAVSGAGDWVFQRRYDGGLILVNLGSEPVTLAAPPQPGFARHLSGASASFPLTLAPASGVVLVP